ncbi:endonuclease/exonuclease/phosphatase family protein [Streptomyces sp. NPDC002004]
MAVTVGRWTAGTVFAGVTLVVGCRAANTDGITPITQVLAFLPWLTAPTIGALLIAAVSRWRTGLVWGLAALAALAWYGEPYGRVADPHGTPVAELRVLASNVQFGRGAPALATAVRRDRPDLVFVEECDPACAALLQDRLPADTYRYRSTVDRPGSGGSVILSRYRLTPTAGVPGTMGMPGAVADVAGHPVRLQLAHPMPPLPRQVSLWRSELGGLRRFADGDGDRPTILAGDFNASQDHAAFRRILDTGLHDGARLAGSPRTPSWPSNAPSPLGTQIDHVLVSRVFSARAVRFLQLTDTDHRAVLVDLTLHAPDAPARTRR